MFFRSLFASVVIAAPSTAFAYDVKLSSTGAPLRWTGGEIALQLALGSGPASPTLDDSVAATQAALISWQRVLDGSGVTMAIDEAGAIPATAHGDGIPSVRWAVEENDPDVEDGRLAITQVSYRVSDGMIQDADVVLNAVEFNFTTAATGCSSEYDLESTLTHELGHLLGLGHSAEPDATMFATGSECEILKRDLSPDDQAGLDHLYRELPPLEAQAVDVDLDTLAEAKGCSAGGGAGAGELALPLMALLAISLLRRRAAVARRAAVIGAALAAFAVQATPAAAGELRLLDLADLGGRADAVVRGVVVASAPAAGGELATDSEVRVTSCFTRDCPATVHVRRRGGEQGGRGLWVEGEAELSQGEEVILYLRARPDGRHRVIGGVQGVLRVRHQAGRVYAVRDLRGHSVLDSGVWRPGSVEVIGLSAVVRSVGSRSVGAAAGQ